jgi:phosphoribosylglycinamide formyltransferase-1
MLSVVVLISGTGSNLLALLKAADHPLFPVRVLAVGSDRAAEGLAHADLYGVPSFVVEPNRFSGTEAWSKKLQETIEHFDPDLIVLAGFMRILPPSFIERFGPNIINTHPSLLPMFPGAHAVRDALAAGARETGVTMHVVDKGVDTGPIIAQKTVTVMPSDDEGSLHERIKVEERKLLVDTVLSIAQKRTELARR